MCDDGYDGQDCSTITIKDYMIDNIIDNFEGSDIDNKPWLQVTGGTIRDTCISEPNSECCIATFILSCSYMEPFD